MRIIPLDIFTAVHIENWQANFYWPISSLELINVRKTLETKLFSVLIEENDQYKKSLIKIVFSLLIREYISLFNSLKIIEDFNHENVCIKVDKQHKWNRLSQDVLLSGIPSSPLFMPAPNLQIKTKSARYYTRKLKRIIKSTSSKSLIVSPSGILYDHLHTGLKGSVKNYEEIFKELKDNKSELSDLVNKLNLMVLEYYERKGIAINKSLSKYLFDYHSLFLNRTANYLKSAKEFISKSRYDSVYFGSGQNYFNRVLAEAARYFNKKAVGHEHGEPKSLRNSSVNYYGELGVVTDFITFTEKCRTNYIKFISDKKALYNIPNIKVSRVGAGEKFFSLINGSDIKRISSSKIIYVSGGYINDALFLANQPHNMLYFEWQLWLWNLIINLGYSLKIKPHPEGLLLFRELKFPRNFKILNGRFEDYLNKNCIFLFDTASSTALTYALASSNPIVFIDDKVNELDPSVKEEMITRVEMVEGYYDEFNRLRVDKLKLEQALINCSFNKTHNFVKSYFYS